MLQSSLQLTAPKKREWYTLTEAKRLVGERAGSYLFTKMARPEGGLISPIVPLEEVKNYRVPARAVEEAQRLLSSPDGLSKMDQEVSNFRQSRLIVGSNVRRQRFGVETRPEKTGPRIQTTSQDPLAGPEGSLEEQAKKARGKTPGFGRYNVPEKSVFKQGMEGLDRLSQMLPTFTPQDALAKSLLTETVKLPLSALDHFREANKVDMRTASPDEQKYALSRIALGAIDVGLIDAPAYALTSKGFKSLVAKGALESGDKELKKAALTALKTDDSLVEGWLDGFRHGKTLDEKAAKEGVGLSFRRPDVPKVEFRPSKGTPTEQARSRMGAAREAQKAATEQPGYSFSPASKVPEVEANVGAATTPQAPPVSKASPAETPDVEWAKGVRAAKDLGNANVPQKALNQADAILAKTGNAPLERKVEKVTKDGLRDFYATRKPVKGDTWIAKNGVRVEIVSEAKQTPTGSWAFDYNVSGNKSGRIGTVSVASPKWAEPSKVQEAAEKVIKSEDVPISPDDLTTARTRYNKGDINDALSVAAVTSKKRNVTQYVVARSDGYRIVGESLFNAMPGDKYYRVSPSERGALIEQVTAASAVSPPVPQGSLPKGSLSDLQTVSDDAYKSAIESGSSIKEARVEAMGAAYKKAGRTDLDFDGIAARSRQKFEDAAPSKIAKALEGASAERQSAYEKMQAARKAQKSAPKKPSSKLTRGGVQGEPLLPEELDYFKAWAKEKGLQGAKAVEDFLVHVKETGEDVAYWARGLASEKGARGLFGKERPFESGKTPSTPPASPKGGGQAASPATNKGLTGLKQGGLKTTQGQAPQARSVTAPRQYGQASPQSKPTAKSEDVFGLASRFEKEGVGPKGSHFVRAEELAEKGKALLNEKPDRIKTVYSKAERRMALTPEDGALAAARGRQIENRTSELVDELQNGLDDISASEAQAELDELALEMEKVLTVGDALQRTFHQTGMALQVAFRPSFERASLMARAKAANFGDELSMFERSRLEGRISALEAENKALISEKAKIESNLKKPLGGMRSTDTKVRRKALSEGILSDLGLGGKPLEKGFASKQAGAVNIPEGSWQKVNSKMTQLAKIHIADGATELDDIVSRIKKDVPLLSEEDILGFLSGGYRQRRLAADTEKLAINDQLRKIRASAEFKRKTRLQKAATLVGDALVSTQRAMQSGLDISAPFLQGFPGLVVSPSSWAKSWVPGVKPFFKGTKGALAEQAKLEADAAFKFSKSRVAYTEVGGALTKQEETFQGNWIEVVRDLKVPIEGDGLLRRGIRGTGVPGVTQYAEAIGRSNEGFVAFLNKLRLDLFKKFVAGRYDDADVLDDAGRLTNILTGRGDGRMAQALSNKAFAVMFYAPRFMLSTFQNAALPLLLPTFKSSRGKAEAMKAWSKQVSAIVGGLYLYKQFGGEAETDPRSQNYGQVTLPNGSQVNLFKKVTDPVRFFSRQVGGSFNAKGDYKAPSFYNNTFLLGSYLSGKAAPVSRTGFMLATGERFDDKQGKSVDFDPKDKEQMKEVAKDLLIPISWQNALQSEGDESAIAMALFGIDNKPTEKAEKPAPSVPWRGERASSGLKKLKPIGTD